MIEFKILKPVETRFQVEETTPIFQARKEGLWEDRLIGRPQLPEVNVRESDRLPWRRGRHA